MKVLQKFLQFFSVLLLVVFCVGAMAYTPRASSEAYGLFLDSSPHSIPKEFWDMKSSTNRVLKPYSTRGKPIESHPSFRRALMGQYEHLVYQKAHRDIGYLGYPSIYEYRDKESADKRNMRITGSNQDPENQCVAFAKRMTKDISGTSSWYAGLPVMDVKAQSKPHEHRGKMVAYFQNNNVSYWKNGAKRKDGGYEYPVHVGIFLGYGPNGFWIADENWGGSAWYPTGEIRKHFISVGRGYSVSNASHYYFVDIYK